MPDTPSSEPGSRLGTETKITAVCIALSLVATYAATTVTDSFAVQLGVLLGVGVVVPTLINEWRGRRGPSQ